MYIFLQSILRMTAWPMTPPVPFSAFHILLTVFGAGFAVSFARFFGKKIRSMASPEPYFRHILFSCGVLLALMELYKQAFLYVIEFHGHFDWWYFPFQLCSIPMYLGLGIPFVPSKLKNSFYSFIQDFGLLGGIMALAEPSGLMHPYITLTVHGFLWHFILIFMGLICAFYNHGKRGRPLFLFLICTAIATVINVLSHPYGNADMFYISPYYPNDQIVFHQISLVTGTILGNCLYLTSVLLGGFIIHMICLKLKIR